ncbi:MAG TPA: hypothetical protein VEL79_06170, partial [Vicinamibacterales bacterium]|nr:hypothetical protein [Vicinamibacterales bacterium]
MPVPRLASLSYAVPDGMPDPVPGARVLVPLGRRVITGVVMSEDRGARTEERSKPDQRRPSTLDPRTSDLKPRPLIDVLDAEPFLPADVVTLAAWVADYYACGVGEAIATAMPPR